MARPMKRRRVCSLPDINRFGPLDAPVSPGDQIDMTVDEYEAIRLIDLESFTQEECAQQMNIARSTVQGIYVEARRKLADALVNGKLLLIQGGQFRLCDGTGDGFGEGCGRGCRRRRRGEGGGGRGGRDRGRGW
ncbi:MAG: DUF134 domain-containing protein [Clostridiaceae bacterium]|nr:DUF134 domain-containing protein [Clostridiaceae bacterium]